MNNKKKIVYVSVSVLGLLLIVLGVSYAWFTLTIQGTKTQVIKTGTLELTLDETASEGITLNNAMPLSDEVGMATTSYKFTLKNTGNLSVNYTLKLQDETITGTRMPDTAVKYYFKKGSTIKGPALLSTVSNRQLDSGTLAAGASINYELKVWMDYDAGNEMQGTRFNTKIVVSGTQVS